MSISVEKVFDQFGVKILLDESRFSSIINDLSPDANETERKVIRRMAQAHILKELYEDVFSEEADREAGSSRIIIRMKEEGFTEEWCRIAVTAFGLNPDAIAAAYSSAEAQREASDKPASDTGNVKAASQAHTNTQLEIYLSMAIDEIDGKDYAAAQKVLHKALYEAPRDGRTLFLAAAAYDGDKRDLYLKRLSEVSAEPAEYEYQVIQQSINKERYLYAFYFAKDIGRVKMCLENGANPNMLYPELAYIVKDAGIFTADTVNYDTHDGFGTIFFCSVYEQDYELTKLCLKAGATMYPEKVCRLNTQNPDNCANPSRCAVMFRIMRSNDLKMLQLIREYIPEIVNIEFASRTMHIAYQNDGRIAVDNDIGHADVYAGADQSPLSYCIEYDTGDFYNRLSATCSLMKCTDLLPFDAVLKSGAAHRYLETAKWLIANGAKATRLSDSVMFYYTPPKAAYKVSLLSIAVDRGNLEMVQAILESGAITKDIMDIAISWSTHDAVTDCLVRHGADASKAPSKTNGVSSGSKKGGCYIATAVYGSYDCPEVWTLRRFRDRYLLDHALGRLFVKAYYAVSPTVVRCFKDNRLFNSINRKALNAWVKHLREKGYEETPYQDP